MLRAAFCCSYAERRVLGSRAFMLYPKKGLRSATSEMAVAKLFFRGLAVPGAAKADVGKATSVRPTSRIERCENQTAALAISRGTWFEEVGISQRVGELRVARFARGRLLRHACQARGGFAL